MRLPTPHTTHATTSHLSTTPNDILDRPSPRQSPRGPVRECPGRCSSSSDTPSSRCRGRLRAVPVPARRRWRVRNVGLGAYLAIFLRYCHSLVRWSSTDSATRHLKCDGVCCASIEYSKASCPLINLHFRRASRYAEGVRPRAANATTPHHAAANDAVRSDARVESPLIPHPLPPPPAFPSPHSRRCLPLPGPSISLPTASPAKVSIPAQTSRR